MADLPVIFGPDLENNVSRERTMLMNLKIGAYATETASNRWNSPR